MSIPWYVLPPDVQVDGALAHHDTAGWTLTARVAQRPGTGADWLVFDVPDNTPDQNGCWLTITGKNGKAIYQLHGVLFLHPPSGAILGVDIFPKPAPTGSVRPFRLDGHFPRYDDGTEMLINESTGFRLFARYRAGEVSAEDFVRTCCENGLNMVRVAGLQDTSLYLPDPRLQYRIAPDDDTYYRDLDAFMDWLESYGLYVDFICCTQTQTLMPNPAAQIRHVSNVFEILHDRYALVSKVNEHGVYDNTVDGSVLLLAKPAGAKFLLSTGSLDSSNRAPFLPLADTIEEHFNDANEWQRKSKDVMDDGNARDKAGYVSETTRTDKDTNAAGLPRALQHYEDNANVATSMTMAAVIHTPEGKNADPFDYSLPHIAAHNRGIALGGIAYRRGRYSRDDVPPAGLIRQYYMTLDGLGTHPIPVRM